jgi:hypothetical protein
MRQKYSVLKEHVIILFCMILGIAALSLVGCTGYSSESLFDDSVRSVYLQMFDNQSFQRDIEYQLTDALAKRIEADTPYKIVSNRNKADSIISGQITSASTSAITTERQTGRALENEVTITAVVTWENLKTGNMIIEKMPMSASASFSEWQSQGFSYGSTLAANNLAKRIVESMEKKWQ